MLPRAPLRGAGLRVEIRTGADRRVLDPGQRACRSFPSPVRNLRTSLPCDERVVSSPSIVVARSIASCEAVNVPTLREQPQVIAAALSQWHMRRTACARDNGHSRAEKPPKTLIHRGMGGDLLSGFVAASSCPAVCTCAFRSIDLLMLARLSERARWLGCDIVALAPRLSAHRHGFGSIAAPLSHILAPLEQRATDHAESADRRLTTSFELR